MNIAGQLLLAPAMYYVTNRTVTHLISSRADREDLDESILSWVRTARKLIEYKASPVSADHPAAAATQMVLGTVEQIEYLLRRARRDDIGRWSLTKSIWPSDFAALNRKLRSLRVELDERMKILLKLLKIPERHKQN